MLEDGSNDYAKHLKTIKDAIPELKKDWKSSRHEYEGDLEMWAIHQVEKLTGVKYKADYLLKDDSELPSIKANNKLQDRLIHALMHEIRPPSQRAMKAMAKIKDMASGIKINAEFSGNSIIVYADAWVSSPKGKTLLQELHKIGKQVAHNEISIPISKLQ